MAVLVAALVTSVAAFYSALNDSSSAADDGCAAMRELVDMGIRVDPMEYSTCSKSGRAGNPYTDTWGR